MGTSASPASASSLKSGQTHPGLRTVGSRSGEVVAGSSRGSWRVRRRGLRAKGVEGPFRWPDAGRVQPVSLAVLPREFPVFSQVSDCLAERLDGVGDRLEKAWVEESPCLAVEAAMRAMVGLGVSGLVEIDWAVRRDLLRGQLRTPRSDGGVLVAEPRHEPRDHDEHLVPRSDDLVAPAVERRIDDE